MMKQPIKIHLSLVIVNKIIRYTTDLLGDLQTFNFVIAYMGETTYWTKIKTGPALRQKINMTYWEKVDVKDKVANTWEQ